MGTQHTITGIGTQHTITGIGTHHTIIGGYCMLGEIPHPRRSKSTLLPGEGSQVTIQVVHPLFDAPATTNLHHKTEHEVTKTSNFWSRNRFTQKRVAEESRSRSTRRGSRYGGRSGSSVKERVNSRGKS
tara:strand:+ start:124 stop:510 length:387 start_codon:yes stop_codon:yes gene_type:complete